MKNLKKYIHIYITTVSMLAFLTGWGFLAHTPAASASRTVTTTSQNITSTAPAQASSGLFSVTPSTRNRSSQSTTRLRTSGS